MEIVITCNLSEKYVMYPFAMKYNDFRSPSLVNVQKTMEKLTNIVVQSKINVDLVNDNLLQTFKKYWQLIQCALGSSKDSSWISSN